IDPVGFSFSGEDRHRGTPSDSLSQAALLRDFFFGGRDDAPTVGLDATVTGLTPNQPYNVSLWSYDTESKNARVSDWSVVDARGTVTVKEDYTFDGSVLPTSDADHRFAFRSVADGSGQIVIQGRGDPASSGPGDPTPPAVFLNALRIDTVEPPPTELAIDVNDRGATGAGSTQPGFQEFVVQGGTVQSATRVFDGTRVTISGLDGSIDDRRRGVPSNGSDFTEQELLRDFLFAGNVGGVLEAMEVRVEGLEPGGHYVTTVWSADDGSPSARVSQWSANGEVVREEYSFDGGALSGGDPTPPANGYSFRFAAQADATGQMVITGQAQPTNAPAVFLNALKLEAVDPRTLTSSTFAQTVLDQQPLAYWRCDDAGPTLTAADASPNNNPARYNDIYGSTVHAPDPASGFQGFGPTNMAAMMGSNSGITHDIGPDHGLLNDGVGTHQMGSEAGTISMWVNVGDGIDGPSARVLFQGSDAARGGFSANAITAGIGTNTYGPAQAGRLIAKGGANTAWGTTDIRDGNWHLVTTTWDGTDVNLYLDGQRTVEATANVGNPSVPFTGQFRFGKATDRVYEGLMDEIAVFKRPLTPAEIQAQYRTALDGLRRLPALSVDIGSNGHPIQDGFSTFELPTSPGGGDHSRTYASDFAASPDGVTVTLSGPGGLNGARSRGALAHTLGDLATSFVFDSSALNVIFSNLAPGDYELVTYHHDRNHQQKYMDILVTDAAGTAVPRALDVRASTGINPDDIASGFVTFTADGLNDVIITFQDNGLYTRGGSVVALSGFELTAAIPEPTTLTLLGLGALALARRRRK
ncbi:MAG: LamG domain-containing protein, partial [Planctomycetota bacterium]